MSPPEKPIVLVGMMGAGKSTIGGMLAQALGRSFFDSDREVERRAGRPIAEIFRENGEAAFRALEKEVLSELLACNNTVIATGGGAFLDEGLSALILQKTTSIWLKGKPKEMFERAQKEGNRILLHGENPWETYQTLYSRRKGAYARAELIIEIIEGSPEKTLALILAALEG